MVCGGRESKSDDLRRGTIQERIFIKINENDDAPFGEYNYQIALISKLPADTLPKSVRSSIATISISDFESKNVINIIRKVEPWCEIRVWKTD
jgi:hypothetical protein